MWRPFHDRSVLSRAPKDGRRDYKWDNNLQSGISNNLGFAGQVILLSTIGHLKPHIVSIPWMQAHCLELETQDTNQGLEKNGNDPLVSVGCFLISFTLNILREVGALPQEAARYTPPRFYSDSLASGPVAATSLYIWWMIELSLNKHTS